MSVCRERQIRGVKSECGRERDIESETDRDRESERERVCVGEGDKLEVERMSVGERQRE